MLEEGVGLMLVGMGVVFLFLTIMVVLMRFSAAFFIRFAHLFAEAQVQQAVVTVPVTREQRVGEEVAVAIAAAMRQRMRSGAAGRRDG